MTLFSTGVCAEKNEVKKNSNPLSISKSDEPIFITSDNLSVDNETRKFTYTGNVVAKQGDMTLTSKLLEGWYNEKNELKDLVATQNVVIVKGEGIRATSQRATYDARQEVFVLTEHPQLTEKESVLEAEVVKVFTQENRTVAEGQVRVKMIKAQKPK
jgi:lipopolysaccharide export system protein LptA